jgi:shikimate dehydrogenase
MPDAQLIPLRAAGVAPTAFVAGHPISHSRSPAIHGHWLAAYELDGRYKAIDVTPGTLSLLFDRVRQGEFAGGNVTVPLKEEAFAAVDRLTPLATRIGAVNTVWMQDGLLHGDNTDIAGFAANLDDKAPAWRKAGKALVVGAGGAARAVILALADAGIAEIVILNRTVTRAAEIAAAMSSPASAMSSGPLSDFGAQLADADLVINTTALGMAGKVEQGGTEPDFRFVFSAARPGAIAADIVYVPLETPFLAAARASGLTCVDGLGMLLHQAVPGFERWFGVRPVVTAALRARIEATLPAPAGAKP